MSQRTPRQHWAAIILSVCVTATALSACSAEQLKASVTSPEKQGARPIVPRASFTRPGEPEILIPVETIIGGQQKMDGVVGEFTRILIGTGNTVNLINPVAVGGVKDQLYIVDAGARAIYRYDISTKAIRTLGQAGGQFIGEPMGIYVESDLSFYVADPNGKQVLYFDANGTLIRTFSDISNLSRPIDVVVDEARGQVFVADGTYSHVVVFSKTGQAMFAIGSRGRGPGKFRAITAIAKGRDSLFVADRLELPLQEIDINTGAFRYSFGQGQLVWPTAIVLDRDNRIFVSDRSDNTIKAFDDVRLIATFGGAGSAPGRFRQVTSMWLSENDMLYVADSLNRRVQVLRVVTDNTNQVPATSP